MAGLSPRLEISCAEPVSSLAPPIQFSAKEVSSTAGSQGILYSMPPQMLLMPVLPMRYESPVAQPIIVNFSSPSFVDSLNIDYGSQDFDYTDLSIIDHDTNPMSTSRSQSAQRQPEFCVCHESTNQNFLPWNYSTSSNTYSLSTSGGKELVYSPATEFPDSNDTPLIYQLSHRDAPTRPESSDCEVQTSFSRPNSKICDEETHKIPIPIPAQCALSSSPCETAFSRRTNKVNSKLDSPKVNKTTKRARLDRAKYERMATCAKSCPEYENAEAAPTPPHVDPGKGCVDAPAVFTTKDSVGVTSKNEPDGSLDSPSSDDPSDQDFHPSRPQKRKGSAQEPSFKSRKKKNCKVSNLRPTSTYKNSAGEPSAPTEESLFFKIDNARDGAEPKPSKAEEGDTPRKLRVSRAPALKKNICRKIRGLVSCGGHCGLKFGSCQMLVDHLDSSHARTYRPHLCPEKDCVWSILGFHKWTECMRHYRSQHCGPLYICGVPKCKKTFLRSDSCRRHIRMAHMNPKSRFNSQQ